ncbi:MAG: hypothetical protein ABI305_11120 [Tepidiformaceae bacterium]
MTAPTEPETSVRYEGTAVATELWGMTQANFSVRIPGRRAKEVGVMLNDPAARFLATELGQEDTREFRVAASRHAGAYLLEKLLRAGLYIDGSVDLSERTLAAHPDILEHLKRTRKQP